MTEIIEEPEEYKSPNELIAEAQAANDRKSLWDKLGFLKGLKGHVKPNIAKLYESEASKLLTKQIGKDGK